MTAPEILYLTMMSVMKVCSRSQNLCPGRSVRNASTELSVTVPVIIFGYQWAPCCLSIAGCGLSGVACISVGCFVCVTVRAFFPSGIYDAEASLSFFDGLPVLLGGSHCFELCVGQIALEILRYDSDLM